MPQLPKEEAEKVNEAEGFAAAEEGVYVATLMGVEESAQPGDSGYHYWIATFSELFAADDEDWDNPTSTIPGNMWLNLSRSPKAEWKMKEFFDAFGVPADTDTDELVGEKCRIVVEQRIIEKGARKGQVGNNIAAVWPLHDEEAEVPVEEPKPKPSAQKERAAARA